MRGLFFMITIKNVHKSFGIQTLLEGASLQINEGDRYALIGPTGSGKSTFLKMLLGEIEPDSGEISLRRGVMMGYLPQENAPVSNRSVLDETLAGIEAPDGRVSAKAKSVLMGLGFKISDFERSLDTLSGGWAMRVAMARLLVQEPNLLMLDEPTNHLDLESLLWFQNYLQSYSGAIFLISHDRDFINNVCRSIVSLEDQSLKVYHGNYDYYLREKEAGRIKLESAWKRQQKEIEDMQDFIARNRVRASTAGRAQSMIKRLEKLERIELPEEMKTVKMRFPQPERTGVKVLALKNVKKSYGDVKVYDGLDFEIERGWKMAFVGHNGAGKSTLLKMLAGVIPFDSGEKVLGLNVKVGYFSQHRVATLDFEKTVLQEAMDNDRNNSIQMVRTVLGSFLFPGESVFKKVNVLSGGEKSRLALVKLLLDPPNVLLMDEPTTHLDMASVDALVSALKDFEGTICFISHDLYLINAIADHIVHVDKGIITVYPGSYEYFQRRVQQKEDDERGPAEHIKEEKHVPRERDMHSESLLSSDPKMLRRQKAQERVERAKDREKTRQTEKIKSEIDALNSQIEFLVKRMEDPKIYADYTRVQKITENIKELQENIKKQESSLILMS